MQIPSMIKQIPILLHFKVVRIKRKTEYKIAESKRKLKKHFINEPLIVKDLNYDYYLFF